MRIPGIRVWRAFSELDHLSDSECISICRRVVVEMPTWRGRLPWVVGIVPLIGSAMLCGVLMHKAGLLTKNFDQIPFWVLGTVVVVVGLSYAFGVLLARDINLYLLIRNDLHRVRCRKCQQSLIGLKVIETALHPGTPGDARVRCPECGRMWTLLELGLSPRDLIPYEERAPDQKVGTLKRPSGVAR